MLAKEIKIKTLKKQREFIKEQLSLAHTRKDGDVTYTYRGYVYPEVVEYFKSEGFEVTKVNSDLLLTVTNGVPIYVFTPRDVNLSEEELKEAEEYEPEASDNDSDDELPNLMKMLLAELGH